MTPREYAVLNNALHTISKDITMDHDGAVFVSTEILLFDGTTLELGAREVERPGEEDELELICFHRSDQTEKGFFAYRAACAARYRRMRGETLTEEEIQAIIEDEVRIASLRDEES